MSEVFGTAVALTPSLYQNLPLKASRHEIRTLVIHRGEPSTTILCSLSVVSLDDHPKFDALSYVWGKTIEKYRIMVNGAPLSISRNLHAVMQRFRCSPQSLTLWIDAICINQENIDERNQQVPLMCRIYSQAVVVIIWLGDADDETKMALDFLETLVHIGRKVWQLPPAARDRECDRAGISTAGKEWAAFERLLERPWFNRVWVWQEVALAKNTWSAVIEVGTFSVHWIYLAGVTNYIPLCGWDRFMSTAIWARVNAMEKGRGALGTEQPMSVVRALSYTRYCDATDPRDKVFALYGLTEDGPKCIDVDYRKTVKAAFTDVSKYLIRTARDLVLLSMVQVTNSDHDLPSWVPDWSVFLYADLLSIVDEAGPPYEGRFKVAVDAKIIVHFDTENPDMLTVSGFGIGTIKGLGGLQQSSSIEQWATKSSTERLYAHSLHNTYQVRSEWYGMLLSLDNVPYPATGETYMRAFARTIIGDRNPDQTRATQKLYSALEQYLLAYEQMDQFGTTYDPRRLGPQSVIEYEDAIATSAGHRKFFVDDGGLIGLAPNGAIEGDTIVLFLGAQVPFIVRKRDNGNYQLIGDCYVHGIMDGELMKAADDRSIGGLMEDLVENYSLT